tara:strand:+ start:1134 stop:1679 length:546 start_codon:yes stop_codon:yes gene_type:complete
MKSEYSKYYLLLALQTNGKWEHLMGSSIHENCKYDQEEKETGELAETWLGFTIVEVPCTWDTTAQYYGVVNAELHKLQTSQRCVPTPPVNAPCITEDEILQLALERLGSMASRLERKVARQMGESLVNIPRKSTRTELHLVNKQRVEIARQLNRKFNIQMGELYIPTWDKAAQAYRCQLGD